MPMGGEYACRGPGGPCRLARSKELCTAKNRISHRGDVRRENRWCRHKAAGLWYTIRRYTQLERLTHRLARWEPGKFLCKSQTKREGVSFGRVFPPLILQGFPGPPSGHGRGKRPFPFRDRKNGRNLERRRNDCHRETNVRSCGRVMRSLLFVVCNTGDNRCDCTAEVSVEREG